MSVELMMRPAAIRKRRQLRESIMKEQSLLNKSIKKMRSIPKLTEAKIEDPLLMDESLLNESLSDECFSMETIMLDESLLMQALDNYGCESISLVDHIESNLGEARIVFQTDESGNISATFGNEIDPADARQYIDNLQQEYTYLVQQMTYRKLIERAKEQGLILESENVGSDRSIVLTFKV